MAKKRNNIAVTPTRVQRKSQFGPALKYTPEIILGLGEELLAWSEKEDSYFINGFLTQRKPFICQKRVSEFAQENEKFAEMLNEAKARMLERLNRHALQKKLDGSFLVRILPLIDLEYRSWRREEMQIEDKNKASKFNLYIHPDRLKSNTEVHDGK